MNDYGWDEYAADKNAELEIERLEQAADAKDAEIERLLEALQNIMTNLEMVGGTAAHLGGAFAIAKQALVEEGKR